jgi:predicted HD phosphohydrolase
MAWHSEDLEGMASTPYHDPAEVIIEKHGEDLSPEQRADLWQTFHSSATPEILAQKLQPHNVSNALKHELWAAKHMTAPQPSHLDKISEALHRVARLNPEVLEAAKNNPTVAKALISAIQSGE